MLTTAIASSASPAERGVARRPSEKFAILILLRPSTVPTCPMTPGTSWFIITSRLP